MDETGLARVGTTKDETAGFVDDPYGMDCHLDLDDDRSTINIGLTNETRGRMDCARRVRRERPD